MSDTRHSILRLSIWWLTIGRLLRKSLWLGWRWCLLALRIRSCRVDVVLRDYVQRLHIEVWLKCAIKSVVLHEH